MRVVPIVGGVDHSTQRRQIDSIPHIIVGTPGRLAEQLENSEVARKYLKNVEIVVLDEADELLNETLVDFVTQILNRVPKSA